MSETLWGVLIGGLLASIMPFVTVARDECRWRKEQRLSFLRDERLRLENMFRLASNKLAEGMAKNVYPTEVLMDSLYVFPDNVFVAIQAMWDDSDRSLERRTFHYAAIIGEMKLALAEIDANVEQTIGSSQPVPPRQRLAARAKSMAGLKKAL